MTSIQATLTMSQDIGGQVRQAVEQARAAQQQAQTQANLAQQQAQEQARAAQEQAREARQQAQEAAREAREQARQAVEQARREIDRARFGRPAVQFPPGFPGQPQIPDGVVIISIAFFAMCAFIAVGFPLARAWSRRLDRRNVAPAGPDPDTRERLERIEQAVDAIAVEVERISEGQRFTTKVIADLRALPQADPSIPMNDRDRAAVPLPRTREAR